MTKSCPVKVTHCRSADDCQSLQYAVEIPAMDANFAAEETGILASDTWILNQDPSTITADGIQPLNALGLRSWYYPRSGYSPITVPAIEPGSSAEAAEFSTVACRTLVTVSDYDADHFPPACCRRLRNTGSATSSSEGSRNLRRTSAAY